MTNQPLISIIIPTYNRAYLIRETLDSIIVQTYTNWECIVVDDGSTDDTEKVLKEYIDKDNRFQYHQRPKDRLKGGSAARNYGFEISKGDYINWFDSDDLMVSTKLEDQLNNIEENRTIYSIGYMSQFGDDKIEVKRKEFHFSLKSKLDLDYFIGKLAWGTINPLWTRGFLEGIDLFDENLKSSQDYDFQIRVLQLGINPSIVKKTLVHYRSSSISITKSTKNIRSEFLARKKHFQFYKNNEGASVYYINKIKNYYKKALLTKQLSLVLFLFKEINTFFKINIKQLFLVFIYSLFILIFTKGHYRLISFLNKLESK